MEQSLAYLQIENDIKNKINSREYLPGSFLPTEKELMRIYDVSRTTIRKAADLLEKEGMIERKRGYGTKVRPLLSHTGFHKFHNITEIRENLLFPEGSEENRTDLSYMHIDKVTAPKEICDFLGNDLASSVYYVSCRQSRLSEHILVSSYFK